MKGKWSPRAVVSWIDCWTEAGLRWSFLNSFQACPDTCILIQKSWQLFFVITNTFYVEVQWHNNMNKVQVQNVKQFPEQSYIVATDLIEVCNLLSISIEQALHDLKSVLIQFSSLISMIVFNIFIELFINTITGVLYMYMVLLNHEN